jgi:hypothetical protein
MSPKIMPDYFTLSLYQMKSEALTGNRGGGFTGCGKSSLFCYFERSEESLLGLSATKEREIPRFAQNDKRLWDFFRSLFSLYGLILQVLTPTD